MTTRSGYNNVCQGQSKKFKDIMPSPSAMDDAKFVVVEKMLPEY